MVVYGACDVVLSTIHVHSHFWRHMHVLAAPLYPLLTAFEVGGMKLDLTSLECEFSAASSPCT